MIGDLKPKRPPSGLGLVGWVGAGRRAGPAGHTALAGSPVVGGWRAPWWARVSVRCAPDPPYQRAFIIDKDWVVSATCSPYGVKEKYDGSLDAGRPVPDADLFGDGRAGSPAASPVA